MSDVEQTVEETEPEAETEEQASDEQALQGDVDELGALAAQRDEYLALAQRTQADFENYRKRVARDSAAAQTRGVVSVARELLPALDNVDRALETAAAARTDAAPTDAGQTDADARARAGARGKTAESGGPTAAGEARESPLLDGVRLLRSELSAALARVGIESYSPLGETFDPALHEAIAQQPIEDAASGTVVEVYQPGYRLGESVIRPARVVVAA